MKKPFSNPEAGEQKIRGLLAQGAWRKARDLAKPLCKVDRPRFLPLLIEANVGLTRDMLSKKLVSEARQVVAYLKTIAPAEVWQELEADLALRSGDYSAAASSAFRTLEQGGTGAADALASADRLVLAFQQPSGIAAAAPSAETTALAAIHQALEAVCAEEYDRASELLRPVSRNSPFRLWKLFVKGLVCFHRGEQDRAAQLFAEVPEDSVPGKAAKPYLYWLGRAKGAKALEEMPEAAWEHLTRLAGAPDRSRQLARAESLWHDDRPTEMYELVCSGIREFPSEQPDWAGALTGFCLNCLFVLPPGLQEDYIAFFDRNTRYRRIRSKLELMMLYRVLAMAGEFDGDAEYLQAQWAHYLKWREHLCGPDPRLTSILYEWIGTFLASEPSAGPSLRLFQPQKRRTPMRDPQGAMFALKKSVDADPSNLEAQLLLAGVFDCLNCKSERNRLLDSMTARFPDQKQVLFLAGNGCIARKAYLKGLSYLERALEQDRLDPGVPEAIVNARMLYALEQFRRGRTAKARLTIEAAQHLAVDRPDDFVRSRWSLDLRDGVLELLYGNPERSRASLAKARAAAPSPDAYLFFGHMLWLSYNGARSRKDPFSEEFRRTCLPAAAAARAPLLLRMFYFWQGRPGVPSLWNTGEMLRDYLSAAARRPFNRRDAIDLIERISSDPGSSIGRAGAAFIQSILKKDPKDPLFRLYDFRRHVDPFMPQEAKRNRLDAIMKEAVRRKDDLAIPAIRHEIDKLHLPSPFPNFGPQPGDMPDLDDLEFEEAVEELLDGFEKILTPRERREFAQMMEQLGDATEEELKRLLETMPPDMPPEILEAMIDSTRRDVPETGRSPAEHRRRRPRRKPSGQKELFEL